MKARESRRAAGPVEQALVRALEGATPLLPRAGVVLVACSGGADSIALAAALVRCARGATGRSLSVALGHVDHGLRAESGAEAEGVRALAERLEVPFLLERLEGLAPLVAREGLEAAAREARYAALLRLARAAGAEAIATAHTRSDQAETLLLRLARGAGPSALSGVRRERMLEGVRLVRPLLEISRAQTEAYCVAQALPFTRDPHNRDPQRARARVRVELPRLAALLNPRLEEALAGTAALLADEDALLTALAADALTAARVGGGASAEALRRLHPALLRRCLLALASEAGARPERAHLARLCALVEEGKGSIDVPRGRARLARGVLRFLPAQGAAALRDAAPPEVAVRGPGRYAWGAAVLEVFAAREEDALTSQLVQVDAARAPLPWMLRGPRPGDRFRPAGGRTKKVSDLLIDARVPRDERPRLALLEDGAGQIFFVEGLRPGAPSRGPHGALLHLCLRRPAHGNWTAPRMS